MGRKLREFRHMLPLMVQESQESRKRVARELQESCMSIVEPHLQYPPQTGLDLK
jgi:hypothetical protein